MQDSYKTIDDAGAGQLFLTEIVTGSITLNPAIITTWFAQLTLR